MEQVVLQVAEQVSQQGEAISTPTKTIAIDYVKFAFTVLKSIIVSLLSNPYVLLALSLIGSYFFFYLKIKARKAEKAAARRQTEKEYADKVGDKIPENKDNNEKDNANRKKLDSME